MELRTASPDDAGWIEEQYRRAGFIPSDLSRHTVVVATDGGERVGLGRLVPAGEGMVELGGMWVTDPYRGRGVARALVEELIRRAGASDVYCVPFADLEGFYASCGFERVKREAAPAALEEKLAWCEREIARPVLLMRLRR
jgi:N-acetylglutamate synthase-like GNAT family acetyltransferase